MDRSRKRQRTDSTYKHVQNTVYIVVYKVDYMPIANVFSSIENARTFSRNIGKDDTYWDVQIHETFLDDFAPYREISDSESTETESD